MKLLALDAATEACSVALKVDSTVTEYFEVCPQQHSQKLLPAVDQLLAQSNVSLNQLDGIVYSQGPGSFTGVRIGVAITQGLAFGADLPVFGVSTLALMAQQAIEEHGAKQVICAIDARMSEIYFAIYDNVDGRAVLQGKEVVCKPDSVALDGYQISETPFSVGTGWQTYQDELQAQFECQSTSIHLPNVKFAFALAEQEFKNGHGKSAEYAQPNYVRDEVTWKKLPGRE